MSDEVVPVRVLVEWIERALKAEAELERVRGPRRCVVCDVVLQARRVTKLYCSNACQQRAKAQRQLANELTNALAEA